MLEYICHSGLVTKLIFIYLTIESRGSKKDNEEESQGRSTLPNGIVAF